MRAAQAAAKARERIKRLALLFADGDIDREGYELGRGQAQADLESADVALARLRAMERPAVLPSLEDVLRLAGGWRTALLGGDTPSQREVLGALIDRLTPERVGYGKYRVEITWTGVGEEFRALVTRAESDAA